MPAFLVTILSILGLALQDLPVVEQFLAGFGTFLANEAIKLWPGGTVSTELTSAVSFAEGVIQDFDTAATDFAGELKQLAPDIETLISKFPFLPKFLMAHQVVAAANPGASATFVINTQQTAHANVRTAAASATATPAA